MLKTTGSHHFSHSLGGNQCGKITSISLVAFIHMVIVLCVTALYSLIILLITDIFDNRMSKHMQNYKIECIKGFAYYSWPVDGKKSQLDTSVTGSYLLGFNLSKDGNFSDFRT